MQVKELLTNKDRLVWPAVFSAVGSFAVSAVLFKHNRQLAHQAAEIKQQLYLAEKRADIDQKTGLLNAEAWKRDITSRIESNKPFGVMFIDINKFKQVNTEHQHVGADKLLDARVKAIENAFRRKGDRLMHEDTNNLHIDEQSGVAIGRYGGDEFGVVVDLPSHDQDGRPYAPEEAMKQEVEYAKEVLEGIVYAQDSNGAKIQDYGATVGYSLWLPGCGLDAEAIIRQADTSMMALKLPAYSV